MDDADLMLSHLPSVSPQSYSQNLSESVWSLTSHLDPAQARFVLPGLSLAHTSPSLATPTPTGGDLPDLAPPLAFQLSSPGLSSPLPVADVRLRADGQTVRVAFSLAGDDIWHGIEVDQVDGGRAIYGTVSRTVGGASLSLARSHCDRELSFRTDRR